MNDAIELDANTEKGLELISDRNMHRILRFIYINYGSFDVKKTMLMRFCTPQALTECLSKLESAKLIRIEARKEPQNVFYIRLTPEGMLFEKADIIETSIASKGRIDAEEIRHQMKEWNDRKNRMVAEDPSVAEFFRSNDISFDF